MSTVRRDLSASVMIYGAAGMTKERRKELAAWLRYHAQALEDEGDGYARCFVSDFYKKDAALVPMRQRERVEA